MSFGTWGFKSPFAHRNELIPSDRRPESGVRDRGRHAAADRPVPIEDRRDPGGHPGVAVVSQRGQPNVRTVGQSAERDRVVGVDELQTQPVPQCVNELVTSPAIAAREKGVSGWPSITRFVSRSHANPHL